MGKDKKKNKDKDKDKGAKGTGARLKALAENPVVADLVAAALVSTAAALKDPKKARAMASDTRDELTALARDGAKKGSAMWQLALDVGRQALDTLTGEAKSSAKTARKTARAATKAAKPAAKARKGAGTTSKAGSKPAVKSAATARKAAAKPARKAPARKPASR